jgi:hypothetical protein
MLGKTAEITHDFEIVEENTALLSTGSN